MKAIVFTGYGSPDVLALREVPMPVPLENEVLVRVHATSLNDWDVAALDGTSLFNRMMFGLLKPKPAKQILGSDIAGVVESAGRRFQPGDAVYGDLSGRWGGLAEYVCAPESLLTRKPPSMSFEQAAAIPQAAMLAVQGLRDVARLQPGQTLLINGAGGGAGTFAIQLARVLGAAEITAVDSTAKLDLMRSLGADHVTDYTREDFTKSGRRYDVILDVKTTRPLRECARALNPNGIFVSMGGEMSRLLAWPWVTMTTKKKIRLVVLKTNKDLDFINELFEAGKIEPVIDGPYPLSETAEAFRRFAEGRHLGKIVIAIGAPG